MGEEGGDNGTIQSHSYSPNNHKGLGFSGNHPFSQLDK